MLNDGLASKLNKHFQENFWLYILSILCIFTGIILGIYSVKYMGEFERNDLISYLIGFTNSSAAQKINNKLVFIEAIKNNIPMILAIWFLGLTIVGIPIILVINVLKGFTIGFTFSFIASGMKVGGIWMAILGVLPQNIIYVPCIIFCSVVAMEFSIMLLKDRMSKQWTNNILTKVISYSGIFIVSILFIFIGFFFEGYITPVLIKFIINNVG